MKSQKYFFNVFTIRGFEGTMIERNQLKIVGNTLNLKCHRKTN